METWLVTLLTPIVTMGATWLATLLKPLPSWLINILTAVFSALAGLLGTLVTTGFPWYIGLAIGLGGTFLYELLKNLKAAAVRTVGAIASIFV
jgi:hypothetical protein